METHPGKEPRRRRSFHTVGNAPTGESVGSFGIAEGNIAGRKTNKQTNK